MKKLLIVLVMVLSGPSILPAQEANPYAQKFWQQIHASCNGVMEWEKTIEEVGEGANYEKESHTYQIDCAEGTVKRIDAEADHAPGLEEFEFLFEYDCQNPYFSAYYDMVKEGESLRAVIKPGNEAETPLQQQAFEVDASGKLRFAESHIVKNTRLYDMDVHIQVWFDAAGHYERHEIRTMTQPVLKSAVRTLIQAQLKR